MNGRQPSKRTMGYKSGYHHEVHALGIEVING